MRRTPTQTSLCLVFALVLTFGCSSPDTGEYPIQPLPFFDVTITDGFWQPRLETNRNVTIPYTLQMSQETGRLDNFAIAGDLKEGTHQGYYFNDSDVSKVIEGAAYSLAIYPDPELEARVDSIIELYAAAQENDGYLYTARTAMTPDKIPPGGEERWSHIEHGHELYCSGHMIEAAIAYYLATGKQQLLDVSLNNADLIDQVFGPDGLRYPPGHQELEIALGKLYRHTGEARYLELANFFLDERGNSEGHELYGEYSQDHIPVVEQTVAVGHAVRAAYMYSGMADIAALTGDDDYVDAIGRIWNDVVSTKLYITGGIGAMEGNEGFSTPYLLPNRTAYSETCASIANAMWNHRMFLLHGDARYIDVAERVIYNAFLSGVSLDGDRFFYPNRLETVEGEERSPWFPCACCPSNVVRFLPSIPGYIYAHSGTDLYVNLFVGSTGTIRTGGGAVTISQTTDYPWDGHVTIRVESTEVMERFAVNVRIPGWSRNEVVPSDLYRFIDAVDSPPTVLVNGEEYDGSTQQGYLRINREWRQGDEISIEFPMPIRRIEAHELVEDDRGKVALQRGPMVFCVEGVDTESGLVRNMVLANATQLSTRFRPTLLGGVQVIEGTSQAVTWAENGNTRNMVEQQFTAIPYYAWAHRGKTEMSVWLASEPSVAEPIPHR